ncbi:hypothetical protein [Sphingomonas sp.]|uniref:hypothetical protein n=1 Tax=Sphingomonas sp. TaxID=28214 RepID=UPI0031D1439F
MAAVLTGLIALFLLAHGCPAPAKKIFRGLRFTNPADIHASRLFSSARRPSFVATTPIPAL